VQRIRQIQIPIRCVQFTTWDEFWTYIKDNHFTVHDDGIPQQPLKRFQQATHSVLASERVEFRTTDTRHTKGLAHRWSKDHYDLDAEEFKYKSLVQPRKIICKESQRISALHVFRRKIMEAYKPLKLHRTVVPQEYTQPVGVLHYFESWYQKGHNQLHDKVGGTFS
jgi:hypothetical protein